MGHLKSLLESQFGGGVESQNKTKTRTEQNKTETARKPSRLAIQDGRPKKKISE